MNTTVADCCITLINLDHSLDSDLWVKIHGNTFMKNIYMSGMVHMYISTNTKVRNGTFNICHNPITPGYFEFADTINRSCKAFNSPVHMVVLPKDHITDKIIKEGSPILFDHLFSHNDIYRDHLASTQHPSPTAMTTQVLGFLGLGNMSIKEAKGYIIHLKAISKRQVKFKESMEEKCAKKRMAEIEGGESSKKKLKTDATGMPSLQAFDSILAAGIVRAKKEIASKKKSMKGKGKATPLVKGKEEFPMIKDLEKAEMALDELMGDDELANYAADNGYLI
ncbi:hypothetical protein EDD85DRAFT_954484 [Armillaria nabsnona]|nr:hypothetical protein EDD85DRAFT_954484 [Armillaria nabsnona]